MGENLDLLKIVRLGLQVKRLANSKKMSEKCVLAHPAELQVYTIYESEGEQADYMIINESTKKIRSVREFEISKTFLF